MPILHGEMPTDMVVARLGNWGAHTGDLLLPHASARAAALPDRTAPSSVAG